MKSDDLINLEDQISKVNETQLNHFALYIFALDFKHHVKWRVQKSLSEQTDVRTRYDAEQKNDLILMIYERYIDVKKKRRSNLSRKKFHKEYWKFLWLDNMQAASNDVTDNDIMNFFIQKWYIEHFLILKSHEVWVHLSKSDLEFTVFKHM